VVHVTEKLEALVAAGPLPVPGDTLAVGGNQAIPAADTRLRKTRFPVIPRNSESLANFVGRAVVYRYTRSKRLKKRACIGGTLAPTHDGRDGARKKGLRIGQVK
jgi:hypothetical protein